MLFPFSSLWREGKEHIKKSQLFHKPDMGMNWDISAASLPIPLLYPRKSSFFSYLFLCSPQAQVHINSQPLSTDCITSSFAPSQFWEWFHNQYTVYCEKGDYYVKSTVPSAMQLPRTSVWLCDYDGKKTDYSPASVPFNFYCTQKSEPQISCGQTAKIHQRIRGNSAGKRNFGSGQARGEMLDEGVWPKVQKESNLRACKLRWWECRIW